MNNKLLFKLIAPYVYMVVGSCLLFGLLLMAVVPATAPLNGGQLLLMTLGFSAAAGILAAVIARMQTQSFLHSIEYITEAEKDLAGGNFKRRISYAANDEFTAIIDAFNQMAAYVEGVVNEISEVRLRFETLVENSVNGIMVVDPEDCIVYVNPVAMRLLEMRRSDVGHKYVEAIQEYDIINSLDSAREQDRIVSRELVMHVLGGKTVQMSAMPLKTPESLNLGLLLILNDISELKRLETVRKDFIANVSHELKTPVSSIKGYAETILGDPAISDETRQEFLKIIYDETSRLSTMINSLMELTRLETFQFGVNKTDIDLTCVVRTSLDIMKKRSYLKTIGLKYQGPADSLVINSDPDMINQVLVNLLENAINYSPEGTEIKVQLENENDRIKISVADQGCGIPEREQSRIFERFYRVDKDRSRKTGGTGLGLSVVKHMVENLGGSVGVSSVAGQGATFYFYLPVE